MREGGQIEKSLDKVIEAAVAISVPIKAMYSFSIPGLASLRWPLTADFDEPSLKLFQQVKERSAEGSPAHHY